MNYLVSADGTGAERLALDAALTSSSTATIGTFAAMFRFRNTFRRVTARYAA
jgi:hypothetical protein